MHVGWGVGGGELVVDSTNSPETNFPVLIHKYIIVSLHLCLEIYLSVISSIVVANLESNYTH